MVSASAAPVGTVYDASMEAQSIVRRWACVVVVSIFIAFVLLVAVVCGSVVASTLFSS